MKYTRKGYKKGLMQKLFFSFLIFIYMKSLFLLIINIFIALKVKYQRSHFLSFFMELLSVLDVSVT